MIKKEWEENSECCNAPMIFGMFRLTRFGTPIYKDNGLTFLCTKCQNPAGGYEKSIELREKWAKDLLTKNKK